MRARKGLAAVFAALVMTAVQAANLSVTDVKIAQRYPWNGLVDITYTVNCDDPSKDVWVYPVGYDADTQTSVALMPEYLSGAGASNAVHNGTHQMTWNMAKQMGKDYNRAAFSVTLHAYCDAAPYMVIDLSAGSEAEKYEVSYLSEIPEGGWTDEYKTTKMVFRLVPPGTFMMGSPEDEMSGEDAAHKGGRRIYTTPRAKRPNLAGIEYGYMGGAETLHRVTLTKPYYCCVFELTKGQYALISGSSVNDDLRLPQNKISYDDLRGGVLGAKWPTHQQVDADSLIGKLRLRTGVTIDLPTEAQWEYACRAGSSLLRPVAEFTYGFNLHSIVGSHAPNAWGFYDTVGNVWEFCLEKYCEDLEEFDVIDPGTKWGQYCVLRGGGAYGSTGNPGNPQQYAYFEGGCRSAARWYAFEANVAYDYVSYTGICAGDRGSAFGARLVALPVCK